MRGFLEPQVLVEWLRPLDSTKRSGSMPFFVFFFFSMTFFILLDGHAFLMAFKFVDALLF